MIEKENSFAMEILKELSQQNKRLVKAIAIITLTLSLLLFSTNAGWVWYLNQYDYVSETYEVDSEDNGNAIINEGGDVNIGESKENNKEENKKE